jgi:iron complex outermembrane receptor protein
MPSRRTPKKQQVGTMQEQDEMNGGARMAHRATATRLSLRLAASLLALGTGMGAATNAAAQTAPAATPADPAGDDGHGDIIVTAQFKKQRIQETPLAISAVSGNMMDDRGLKDVSAVTKLVPNVFVERQVAGTGAGASAYIRGVGQSDPSFAVEPGVGIYVDDVYYGVISGSLFETLDLDRVEVLRGPQGTLAGKNSIGGAIKLYSRRPDDTTDGYAEIGYGSYNRVNLRAAANLTIIPDKLYVRLSGSGRRADGYLTRLDYDCVTGSTAFPSQRTGNGCKIGSEGGQKLFTGRAALRWLVTDGIEDNLIVDTIQDDSENPAGKLTVQNAAWAGTNNFMTPKGSYTNYAAYIGDPGLPDQFSYSPNTTVHGWGLSNNLSIDLASNVKLTSITGYRVTRTYFPVDLDVSPADVLDQLWYLNHRQVTQELRVSGDLADKFLEWTVGGFYYHAHGISRTRLNLLGGLALNGGGINLRVLTDDTINTTSKSAFGQVVVHPLPKLSLTGAVRWTNDRKTYLFERYNTNGGPHPTLGVLSGVTGIYDGDRVDYRFAADYKITPGVLVYAQYATGFKGGGINPRPYFASQVVPFDPETLTSYEAGIKSDLFDRLLRLNAAVFYNRFKDVQGKINSCPAITPNGAAGPCAAATNIGDAEIKGAEAEAELHAGHLLINASLGYLDFKYTKVLPKTGVTLDMTNVYTPKLTASGGIQYGVDVGGGSITPRFQISYLSHTYSDAVNTPLTRIESRALADAQVMWSTGKDWDVTLSVSNVFGTFKYINYYQTGTPVYNAQIGQPTPPRQWLLTVKRRF